MRSGLVLSLWLAGTALAAPLPNQPAATKATSPTQVGQLPEVLLRAVNQIAEQYVRRILPQHLVLSALSGLYESARLPVPGGLRAQVLGAENEQELAAVIRSAMQETAGGLEGRDPVQTALAALLRSLDAHSTLVNALEQRRNAVQGVDTFGVGLEVEEGRGPLVVRTVYPGGPAQMAGLRPGDVLLRLNGQPAQELTADQVARLLHNNPEDGSSIPPPPGIPGSSPTDQPATLRLVYRRKGPAKPAEVELTLQRFRPETVVGVTRRDDNTWNYWLDPKDKIAHVRLLTLARNTGQELFEVVSRLNDQGLRGLVLDLRWCPGGYLNEAVECARLFVGEGLIATIQSRNREDQVYRSQGEAAFPKLPLVVLLNADTSGGAELIAAALQDHKRAVICGQRSRGKGSVQTPIHLNVPDLGVKLTTGTFLRPSGKNLHRFADSKASDDWGIRPDPGCEFRLSSDLSKCLGEWWQLQTLRPARATERLPLDDPTTDSQRTAAAARLRELLQKPPSSSAAP
jgi:carboxyl-terminal processing protease